MGDSAGYRLTFGAHKNKTLQELPPSYRSWLIREKVYADKPNLQAALMAGNYLAPTSDPLTPPSTPTPSSQKRKRPALFDDSETAGSPSSRRKLAISSAARRNGTMLNYDGSAYILDFGQHFGAQLSAVPSSYIRYLINEGAHTTRPDLTAALHEQGFLTKPAPESSPPSSSGESAIASSSSSQQSPAVWRAPSIHATNDARFFDPHRQTPRWISDADALSYFGLEEALLSARGVGLVTEEDLKRNTPFSELVSVLKGAKRRWLYQVYACACAGFGSVLPERGTADEAVGEFLEKNRRREGEIWDAMGFDL